MQQCRARWFWKCLWDVIDGSEDANVSPAKGELLSFTSFCSWETNIVLNLWGTHFLELTSEWLTLRLQTQLKLFYAEHTLSYVCFASSLPSPTNIFFSWWTLMSCAGATSDLRLPAGFYMIPSWPLSGSACTTESLTHKVRSWTCALVSLLLRCPQWRISHGNRVTSGWRLPRLASTLLTSYSVKLKFHWEAVCSSVPSVT